MKKHSLWNLFCKYILRKPRNILIQGVGNQIILVQENGTEKQLRNGGYFSGLRISIRGDHNTLKIHLPFNAIGSEINIILTDHSYTEIGIPHKFFRSKILLFRTKGSHLKIRESAMLHRTTLKLTAYSSLSIGKNCIFATGTYIKASDSHTILEKSTNEVINNKKTPLVIGDHCWIGNGALLTKNAHIPNNSIIGARSVVTKTFTEEYTVIAGNPAIVVKRDVDWNIMDIIEYSKANDLLLD